MPFWIQQHPLSFLRRRARRDLAKVTTLGLANLAYAVQKRDGGTAQDHFDDLLSMHDPVINGHRRTLQASEFVPSRALEKTDLDAQTEVHLENSGSGRAVLRIVRVLTRRRPTASISEDLLLHEQIHLDTAAFGCMLVNRAGRSVSEKKTMVIPLQQALNDWADTQYDDPVGKKPVLKGTFHGRNIEVQRAFWNSGSWVPFFVDFIHARLGL